MYLLTWMFANSVDSVELNKRFLVLNAKPLPLFKRHLLRCDTCCCCSAPSKQNPIYFGLPKMWKYLRQIKQINSSLWSRLWFLSSVCSNTEMLAFCRNENRDFDSLSPFTANCCCYLPAFRKNELNANNFTQADWTS